MATQMQLEVILIGENRKKWGRNGAQGSLHWWRSVDKIPLSVTTLRLNNSNAVNSNTEKRLLFY